MTLRYDFALNNPALPRVRSIAETISGLAGLVGWYQADDDYVDLVAGRISAWRPRAGSGPSFVQATAAKQATLDAAAIGNYPAAGFRRAAICAYEADAAVPLTGEISMVAIWKHTLAGTGNDQNVMAALESATARFGFGTKSTAGEGQAYVGNTALTVPMPINEWQLTIMEKTASQFRVRSGGQTSALTAHNNATSSARVCLGSATPTNVTALQGSVADFFIFNRTIIGDVTAFEALRNYAKLVYGINNT